MVFNKHTFTWQKLVQCTCSSSAVAWCYWTDISLEEYRVRLTSPHHTIGARAIANNAPINTSQMILHHGPSLNYVRVTMFGSSMRVTFFRVKWRQTLRSDTPCAAAPLRALSAVSAAIISSLREYFDMLGVGQPFPRTNLLHRCATSPSLLLCIYLDIIPNGKKRGRFQIPGVVLLQSLPSDFRGGAGGQCATVSSTQALIS